MTMRDLLLLVLVVLFQRVQTIPLENSWTEGHKMILRELFLTGTDEEKWIVSSLSESVVQNFPKLTIEDLPKIHPDILWRLSDQIFIKSSGFSGAALANLTDTLIHRCDLTIIRKATSILENASLKDFRIDFLENLKNDVGPAAWKILGTSASTWWPKWSEMVTDLTTISNTLNVISLLLNLPQNAYRFCNDTRSEEKLCLDDALFTGEPISNLGKLLTKTFQKEANPKKRQIYFNLWNDILCEKTAPQNGTPPLNVSSNFFTELPPSKREVVWFQHHSLNSTDEILFRDFPLLHLMQNFSVEGLNNIDLLMSDFVNVTHMALHFNLTGAIEASEAVATALKGSGDTDSVLPLDFSDPLVLTMTKEKICSMSMKQIANIPIATLTSDLVKSLKSCLSIGQQMALSKKLLNKFGPLQIVEMIPADFISSLTLEDFQALVEAVFNSSGPEGLSLNSILGDSTLTFSQEAFIFDLFFSKINENADIEFMWKFLKSIISYRKSERILSYFFPSNISDKVEFIVEQLNNEKFEKSVPHLIASIFISGQKKKDRRTFFVETLGDTHQSSLLISGMSCYQLSDSAIPKVSLIRLADNFVSHYVSQIANGNLLQRDFDTLNCLADQLSGLESAFLTVAEKKYLKLVKSQVEKLISKEQVNEDHEKSKFDFWTSKLHNECVTNSITEENNIINKFGPIKNWSSDVLEVLAESILHLKESTELTEMPSKELSLGIKRFIRFWSKQMTEATPLALRTCYGETYVDDYNMLSDLYLKTFIVDESMNNNNNNNNKEEEVDLISMNDFQSPLHSQIKKTKSSRLRRSVFNRCNFTNHQFTTELFTHVSEMVWNKLDTSNDENRPQIGPLLMDMRHHRQLILVGILRLDPDMTGDHILATAKEMFSNNMVPSEDKQRILDAFSDLHMKAVRRLVLAGKLRPQDLILDCQIDPIDLYLVFPPNVVDTYYKEVGLSMQNNVPAILQQPPIDDTVSPCGSNCLLPILVNGSQASTSRMITNPQFQKGLEVIEKVYLRAVTILNNNPQDSQIEAMLKEERTTYFSRLREIFEKEGTPDDELISNLAAQATIDHNIKMVYDQEQLRYHYNILKKSIEMLRIPSAVLLIKNEVDKIPTDVVNDLFPPGTEDDSTTLEPAILLEDALDTFSNSLTPIMEMTNRIPEPPSVSADSLEPTQEPFTPVEEDATVVNEQRGQLVTSFRDNVDLKEFLFKENLDKDLGNPVINLYCSYRLTVASRDRLCPKDLLDRGTQMFDKLLQAPDFFHQWLRDWVASNFALAEFDRSHLNAFVDQQLIQALYLKLLSHISTNLSVANLKEFLKLEGISRMTYPEGPFSETKRFGALKQMLDISKSMVSKFEISPTDLTERMPMDNPILSIVFESYMKQQIRQNSKFHTLMCDYDLMKLECPSLNVSVKPVYKDLLLAKEGLKAKFLYQAAKVFLLEASSRFNRSVVIQMDVVENSVPNILCQIVADKFLHSDFVPCSKYAIHLLSFAPDETILEELESSLAAAMLHAAKVSARILSLEPADIDVKQYLTDTTVQKVFEEFLANRNDEILQTIMDVHPLYQKTKTLLLEKSDNNELTPGQARQAKLLIDDVNSNSKILFQKLFNVEEVEGNLGQDLIEKIRDSDQFNADVKEKLYRHILVQKVFVIRKLVDILHLTKIDFEPELLRRLTPAIGQRIFKTWDFEEPTNEPEMELRSLKPKKKKMFQIFEDDDEDLERLLDLKSYGVYRRDAEVSQLNKPTLQHMIIVAFHLYHKAITIALDKRDTDQLDQTQSETLKQILETQVENIYSNLRTFLGGPTPVLKNGPDQNLAFVLLTEALTNNQTIHLDSEILKHHLKVTKQIIILMQLTPGDFDLDPNFPLPDGISKYLFGSVPHLAGRTNEYLNAVNLIYQDVRRILSMMAQRGELSAKQTITAKKIIYELNKQSVTAMVNLLKLNDTTLSPDELIELIKQKRIDSTLEDGVELKIKEIVYFKKLKAIKDLVDLLKVTRPQVQFPANTPDDLIDLIFTSDASQLNNLDVSNHNPFNSNWNPPQVNTPDYSSAGFFCMGCFHRAYEQWKRDQGLSSDGSQVRRDADSQLSNKDGGLFNQDILDQTIGDLNNNFDEPSFTYLMAPEKKMLIFEDSPGKNTLKRSKGIEQIDRDHKGSDDEEDLMMDVPDVKVYTGQILHLYNRIVKVASERRLLGLPKDQSLELATVIEGQKQLVYQELPLVLESGSYYTVERPYGILLQTLPTESSETVAEFIAKFHLDVVRKVVAVLKLSPKEVDPEDSIPDILKDYIFRFPKNLIIVTPVNPDRLRAINIVFDFIKRTLLSRHQNGLLTNNQLSDAQSIVRNLELEKRELVHQVLNVTLDENEDLKQLIKNKIDREEVTKAQSDRLERLDFDLKLEAIKELVTVLAIKRNQIPGYADLNQSVLQDIFRPAKSERSDHIHHVLAKSVDQTLTDEDMSFLELPPLHLGGRNYETVMQQINEVTKPANEGVTMAMRIPIQEMDFDEGDEAAQDIAAASFGAETDLFVTVMKSAGQTFPGCDALRSTGLKDISLTSFNMIDISKTNKWLPCIDIFRMEQFQHFGPIDGAEVDSMTEMILLKQQSPSLNLTKFDELSLEVVAAMAENPQQDVQICDLSESILENYLHQRGSENLTAFETILLARLPCVELAENDLFQRLIESTTHHFAIANVIQSKKILMFTNKFKTNLQLLIKKVLPPNDIFAITREDVESLGVCLAGVMPEQIVELSRSSAILGIGLDAAQALDRKQIEAISDDMLRKMPMLLLRKMNRIA